MSNNGVNAAMRERVLRQLQQVEQRYGVKVLYACESGSRGWGFASRTVITTCDFCMFIRQNGICGWKRHVMLLNYP